MTFPRWCAALVAAGVYAVSAAGPTVASAGEPPVTAGGLRVVTESAGELAGAYSAGDYVLAIRAQGNGSGSRATLDLDGRSVSVQDDPRGDAVLDSGGMVLTPADRRAVRGAQQALDRHWARTRILPAHSELAGRLVELMTDAPLGVPIARRRIAAPVEEFSDRRPAPSELRPCPAGSKAAGCQLEDSPDRIRYFATCQTGKRWFGHDWTGHCYDSAQNYSGPSSAHCFGRCGAGCGSSDRGGTYSYDCGDHDQCNRVHNENWGGCGDEFDEAVNDTVKGRRNCPAKSAVVAAEQPTDRQRGGSR